MSHEIRTPINAVLGLNEMILRESKEQQILGYAHDIKSSGNLLLSLVNDVLDFSKIESGKMELVPVSYDFASLLNDVVNMTTVKTDEKKLDFILQIDPKIPTGLYGDEVRLKQIINNILSNAVKYTHAGSVTLYASYRHAENGIRLIVSVTDTGVGMRSEDIEKLFKPFERIDEKNNRNIQGTGLGMAITKYYLQLMGSELKVQSEYGKGSTFTFEVLQSVEKYTPIGDYQTAFERLRQENKGYEARLKAPGAEVLVVDDMDMNLKVVRGLLKETQVNVDTALSGAEALEMMSTKKYHVVFMDHMMPKMSGLEAVKLLRQDRTSPNQGTIVVALTANAVSGAREIYIEAGFDDYLTKPINPTKLEEMLLKYLPENLVESDNAKNLAGQTDAEEELTMLEKLRAMPEIDVEKGIELSVNEEIYEMVVEEFVNSVPDVIEAIKTTHGDKDAYEYTVQVHGLKSMARQAGASALGEQAYELELAGKAEDWDSIDQKTDALIAEAQRIASLLQSAMN